MTEVLSQEEIDALLTAISSGDTDKVAAAESEHNREVLAAWTRDWSGRAASALLPVVELALGPEADAAVAEYVAALSARIAKAGIPA